MRIMSKKNAQQYRDIPQKQEITSNDKKVSGFLQQHANNAKVRTRKRG